MSPALCHCHPHLTAGTGYPGMPSCWQLAGFQPLFAARDKLDTSGSQRLRLREQRQARPCFYLSMGICSAQTPAAQRSLCAPRGWRRSSPGTPAVLSRELRACPARTAQPGGCGEGHGGRKTRGNSGLRSPMFLGSFPSLDVETGDTERVWTSQEGELRCPQAQGGHRAPCPAPPGFSCAGREGNRFFLPPSPGLSLQPASGIPHGLGGFPYPAG